MKYYFRYYSAFMLLLPTLISLGEVSPAKLAATSPTTAPVMVTQQWTVEVYSSHEIISRDSDDSFIAKVLNRSGKDAKIWRMGDAIIDFVGTDKHHNIVEIGGIPGKSIFPDVLHISWHLQAPGKVEDCVLLENGHDSQMDFPEASYQFVLGTFSGSAFALQGQYQLTAILMRGDTELARSETREINVSAQLSKELEKMQSYLRK